MSAKLSVTITIYANIPEDEYGQIRYDAIEQAKHSIRTAGGDCVAEHRRGIPSDKADLLP